MSDPTRRYRGRSKGGRMLARLMAVGCCLVLVNCNAEESGNAQSGSASNNLSSEDEAATDNAAFALHERDRPADPQEIARASREERDNDRFIRWQNRVRPTPADAFPKIGTCYASRIKEVALHHQRISDGKFPDGELLEKGSYYWDDDWAWEAQPIRENGRIAIPFNGHIIYDNGLEQFFEGHWPRKEPPAIARSRVGDKVVMCVTRLPDHCPPGDFRGVVYKTRDLRTGENWEEGDSVHSCGGA